MRERDAFHTRILALQYGEKMKEMKRSSQLDDLLWAFSDRFLIFPFGQEGNVGFSFLLSNQKSYYTAKC